MHVCIVPEYPLNLMTGGLQVQAEETCRALNQLGGGVSAELLAWSEPRPLADVYHFIGFPRYLYRLAELVRDAGRPYFITLLFGGAVSRAGLWQARLRLFANTRILRQQAVRRAIEGARGIMTITEGDAAAARFLYGLEAARIHVVPNGVPDAFFQASPAAWHRQYGPKPFVLCVGALQPRKGQWLLVEACNQLQLPVVLLGPALPGEAAYAQRVQDALRRNAAFGGIWRGDLRNEDELLVSAYGACRLFALLSSSETQPLSVMQAMAAKKPVLLLRAAYLRQGLFQDIPQVTSSSPEAIAAALETAWQRAQATALPAAYSWRAVARQLAAIYGVKQPEAGS